MNDIVIAVVLILTISSSNISGDMRIWIDVIIILGANPISTNYFVRLAVHMNGNMCVCMSDMKISSLSSFCSSEHFFTNNLGFIIYGRDVVQHCCSKAPIAHNQQMDLRGGERTDKLISKGRFADFFPQSVHYH